MDRCLHELLKPASLYHSQVALVPSVPPTTLRVLIVPAQVASSVTLMLVGSTDGVLTVTSALYRGIVAVTFSPYIISRAYKWIN